MMKIFAHVKEIGENDFIKFIAEHGEDYAGCYMDMGSRSYQANASRVSATVLDILVQNQQQQPQNIRILDVASGPEMLKKHVTEPYQEQIVSLDINEHHFSGEGGKRVVGSFTKLPFTNESFDYANLSLALHYTKFIPSQQEYERLQVLQEMNRVLKTGGKAVINLMYNLDLKDPQKFHNVAEALGFRVVEEYSGEVVVGQQYKSRIVTLEKQRNIDDSLETIAENIGKENYDGLKTQKTDKSIKDSRKIIRGF